MFLRVSNDKRSLKIERNKILISTQSRSYPSNPLDLIAPLRAHMTSGDREVVNFTQSRVKTKSKLTNLIKISPIEGYNGK